VRTRRSELKTSVEVGSRGRMLSPLTPRMSLENFIRYLGAVHDEAGFDLAVIGLEVGREHDAHERAEDAGSEARLDHTLNVIRSDDPLLCTVPQHVTSSTEKHIKNHVVKRHAAYHPS